MSNIEALKEQARRHEQKEEWDKACASYLQAIEKLDEEEQPDIGLYNRVGDILIRVGDYEQAIQNFDRAADLYLEAELPNNAIAVCKKVIRHLPNRHDMHLRIGKIRASQGFILDARESFLTYADRMQNEGETEKALEALVEFVELVPDDTDARMSVATQLLQHERTEEALVQLKAGYQASKSNQDDESAKAFEEKLLELDPEVDLEALEATATTGGGAMAFESNPLGFGELDAGLGEPVAAGESEADDEPAEVEADFGEIVVGGDDEGGDDAAAESASEETLEDDDEEMGGFAEISFGGGDDDEASEVVEAETAEAVTSAADTSDEEDVEGPELAFMSLDDDEVGEADDDEDLPLLSDFMSDVDEPDDVGDEEAEPLPFLSMDEGEEADQGDSLDDGAVSAAEEPQTAEMELDSDWAQALEGAHEESVSEAEDLELETDVGAVSEPEDPAQRWQALKERCQGNPSDTDAAQELVEEAFKLEDQPALVESYLILAEALRTSGDEERARSVVEQALSLDPENVRAREWLGEDDAAEASADEPAATGGGFVDLGSLIFDEPREKTTRFQVAYEEPSGDEEADFAKMLSQFKAKVAENFDASDVKAHHDLGTAYKEMGLLDEAVEKFQEALRASPVHLPTYELLGQTFMEKGESAAAVRVLERALKVGSDVEDEFLGIYYYLGRAHEELGQTESALDYYDRVFALDINFSDVTERLRRLR